ncbi:hypothetical protein PUW25_25865 (plasmid) [Paenibacillus urinalis]|uniref:Uncharacterized protein n=2 Tax=Paenibacillus TaxID=44249 RepID=A0ABY7XHJ9_9BACL|nr:hypothetical protein [Paenibacillus urinalis]WDI05239.1 hypothetical protein PUW25_25865 [Paenibacillus urinalis]
MEVILLKFMENEGLEVITLENWKKDARLIFDVIFQREDYKNLEINFKKRGYGSTGLGVYDKQANKFYDCTWTNHFPTIMTIVESEYPDKFPALREFYAMPSIDQHENYTREEIERFVMENFELIGQTKQLDDYLKD